MTGELERKVQRRPFSTLRPERYLGHTRAKSVHLNGPFGGVGSGRRYQWPPVVPNRLIKTSLRQPQALDPLPKVIERSDVLRAIAGLETENGPKTRTTASV